MILDGPPPASDGLWLLEGAPLSGKTCLADPADMARRLERSLSERPPAWARWLGRRFGGPEGALEAFLGQQACFREEAGKSRLSWYTCR